MSLVITPASREEISAIRGRKLLGGKYSGLSERMRELKVDEALWVQRPEDVTMQRHQQYIAATANSMRVNDQMCFMTRRDNKNDRVAVVRTK